MSKPEIAALLWHLSWENCSQALEMKLNNFYLTTNTNQSAGHAKQSIGNKSEFDRYLMIKNIAMKLPLPTQKKGKTSSKTPCLM